MDLHRSSRPFSRKRLSLHHKKISPRQILLWAFLSLTGLFLLGVLSFGIMVAVISVGLPDVHTLNLLVPQSTTIYDRDGKVLYVKYGGENRKYVEYDKISPHLIDATIAIEDDKYWEHPGFNAKGILRALLNPIFHFTDEQQGGSTITQQYVKQAILTSEKSFIRKMRELILSVQLEQTFDKKKILELYLNKIPYGNNAYGIEKAAQIYFDKTAKDLDLAESAILASLPNAPGYYDPYKKHLYSMLTEKFKPEELGSRTIKSQADLRSDEYLRGLIGKNVVLDDTHSVYIQGRSDIILGRMLKLGYITEKQQKEAMEKIQNIVFQDKSNQSSIHAPHFVQYVLDELEEKYDQEIIEQGGLQVYTSLDSRLQEIARSAVKAGADINTQKYKAKNGSLVAINPKNGEILAMVGSKDYFDKTTIDGNVNVTTSYRQPGSTFKPLIYAQAFNNRYAPASVVFDTPLRIGNKTPKNFDASFRGQMTIRSALAQSRNIPAIKAYYAAGEQKPVVELAQKMGIHFPELEDDPNHVFGYPLALGAGIVRPLDMATAFGVFAANGVRHDPISILRVTDSKGDPIPWENDTVGEKVLDPQIAYLINSILSDTTVRLHPNLTVPNHVNAAKSGTSDVLIKGVYYPLDLWTIGYTPSLVAAVWTGNNDPKRDGNIALSADGTTLAAPIWKKFMTEALKNTPSEEFSVPDGIKQVAIATASGKLPGPNTPPDQIKTEVFASFSVPTEIDENYTQVDIDTLCNKLANQYTPEGMKRKVTFVNYQDLMVNPDWQIGVETYFKTHVPEGQQANSSLVLGAPPSESCPERTAENYARRPTISLLSPMAGSTVKAGSRLPVDVQVNPNGYPITKVEFFLDGRFKYSTVTSPYTGEIRLPVGEENGVRHTITAKVHDKLGFTGEVSFEIVTGPSTGSLG